MRICGIKFTHDGGIAVIEDGKLIFSVEMEKLNNNKRFSSIENSEDIIDVLNKYGYSPNDIDKFVIDGWEGLEESYINYYSNGIREEVEVATYHERKPSDNILAPFSSENLKIGKNRFCYNSYMHVTGHVLSAYCTSPFVKKKENSFVLVWDGGMFPRLYYVDVAKSRIENLGSLFYFFGNIYSNFALYFEPFKKMKHYEDAHLSIAGKVMAYIALGKPNKEIINAFKEIYEDDLEMSLNYAAKFARRFKIETRHKNFDHKDILASFHVFLEELLITKLTKKIQSSSNSKENLCIVGGCALNIKWNSAIRNTGSFSDLWVCPFPNDSGSAIGSACAEMFYSSGNLELNWNVFSGPEIELGSGLAGWKSKPCSISELAEFLYRNNKPVVFLNGRAELGPRALGNRSIIASPMHAEMKVTLNKVKKREEYRPIAPICMEEYAEKIFKPGIKDEYMLFDHIVRDEWIERIPAVLHIDKTARLQTVSKKSNPLVYDLLSEFNKLSGIPVLTNTSANHSGRGFFPELDSAMEWGKVDHIWAKNTMYIKN